MPRPRLVPRSRSHVGAAVVIVERGLVLGITRGKNLCDVGFPGGGIEGDESPEEAAVRELHEETGVVVDPRTLVFVDENPGSRGAYAIFLAEEVDEWPEELRSDPFEGHVGFYEPVAFTAPGVTYRDYQRRVMWKLGLL